jgi:hypothetical protein
MLGRDKFLGNIFKLEMGITTKSWLKTKNPKAPAAIRIIGSETL